MRRLRRFLIPSTLAALLLAPTSPAPVRVSAASVNVAVAADRSRPLYVGDYYKKDATNYSTRIGAFRMPGCGR